MGMGHVMMLMNVNTQAHVSTHAGTLWARTSAYVSQDSSYTATLIVVTLMNAVYTMGHAITSALTTLVVDAAAAGLAGDCRQMAGTVPAYSNVLSFDNHLMQRLSVLNLLAQNTVGYSAGLGRISHHILHKKSLSDVGLLQIILGINCNHLDCSLHARREWNHPPFAENLDFCSFLTGVE